MQQVYRIVDWWKYEVTAKGRKAKKDTPMKELRKAPLEYVRFDVHGHSLSAGFRRLVKCSYPYGEIMAWACIGAYKMLCELAGNQTREYRGFILDDRQKPINPSQVAELLTISTERINDIFIILMNDEVRWVELVNVPKPLQSQNGQKIEVKVDNLGAQYASPGFSGTSGVELDSIGLSLNETETVNNNRISETKENERFKNSVPPGISGRRGADVSKDDSWPVGEKLSQPKAQPPPPVTDTVSSMDSASKDFPATVSDSDSVSVSSAGAVPWAVMSGRERIFEITRCCQLAAFEFDHIISCKTNSDRTTINDIFSQMQQRIISGCEQNLFQMSLAIARECLRVADKPMAMFVSAMKNKPFCYVPRKVSLTRGFYPENKTNH